MSETTAKTSNYREDFPGYQGHIPYKIGVIGKTVGATNETIKALLTTEPPKETLLRPADCEDFSQYNRDYYCDTFCRDYPLEEDIIYSNKSKNGQTWICGDKYKIYPQHIPGVECHVPGIKSSNIFGMGYSKSTAVSIKGDYNKKQDCTPEERFRSTAMASFQRPKTKTIQEEKEIEKFKNEVFINPMDSNFRMAKTVTDFKKDLRRIYKSKIAKVPTPGYAGHTSVFKEQIGYLNYDKIMEQEKLEKMIPYELGDELPPKYKQSLNIIKPDTVLPYVVGYKGFRAGIKARNYHGENFHDCSLKARNEAKFLAAARSLSNK
ncbi:MAG: hypothetical protein MJ252_21580 [archaeon]|nr:hypothetical protein [archaeon]